MGKICGLPTKRYGTRHKAGFFVFFFLASYRPIGSLRHGASCGMLVLHEVSNSDMAVCVSVIGKEVIQLSGLFFVAG